MRSLSKLFDRAELNGSGGTRLGARPGHLIALTIVAKRAFVRVTIGRTSRDYSKWTRRHAVTASVADVVLDVDVGKFGGDNRAGRARHFARGRAAMLADIAHHQPTAVSRRVGLRRYRSYCRQG
jgi:hypothetical protein